MRPAKAERNKKLLTTIVWHSAYRAYDLAGATSAPQDLGLQCSDAIPHICFSYSSEVCPAAEQQSHSLGGSSIFL